mmetsp:Transcript_2727/g.4051  ORF Transcript_2727/g.4051 Transcript_2727/m.4051 type:complete len:215 (+) Transcript_2727:41-685(+)
MRIQPPMSMSLWKLTNLLLSALILASFTCYGFTLPPVSTNNFGQISTTLLMSSNLQNEDKFSFGQRIESIKTGIVGLFAGGIAMTPASFIHDIFFGGSVVQNGLAQWEFDTDMGSLQGALFAIVYRYCVRKDDNNEQLNQGVIGAFVVTRTLCKIQVPSYCSAVPLECGDPLGYFDWSMISQAALNGLESAALFGGAALAMDECFRRGWITKFP